MNEYNTSNDTSSNGSGLVGGLLLATGFLIGAATTLLIKEHRPKKAGLVLDMAKTRMASKGTVTGSWIDYDAIEYDLFEDKPLVYLGGITIENNEGQFQYQFASDIYTGEMIDYFLINPK